MREICNCKIQLDDGASLPIRKHSDDAGYDIYANENTIIPARGWKPVSTGVHTNPGKGWYIQVVPRSGLAYNHGVSVLNTPGTVDAGYRDEIKVIMYNISDKDYLVKAGDRIAQLIFTPSYEVKFDVVETLDETDRGTGGFGSTGK